VVVAYAVDLLWARLAKAKGQVLKD
jgi:hypothetical protein